MSNIISMSPICQDYFYIISLLNDIFAVFRNIFFSKKMSLFLVNSFWEESKLFKQLSLLEFYLLLSKWIAIFSTIEIVFCPKASRTIFKQSIFILHIIICWFYVPLKRIELCLNILTACSLLLAIIIFLDYASCCSKIIYPSLKN